MTTIKNILTRSIKELKYADIDAPVLEAGAMLCHVLKKDRTFLYSHNDYIMSEAEIKEFSDLIEQRKSGKPFQYIIGQQEFMSLKFLVNQYVLIPRQDTEILVETIINKCNNWDKINILDIGTGSGCIAVSLAYYIKDCRVTAIDVSEEILNVAKSNSILNGVQEKISFYKCDIINDDIFSFQNSAFDIIVSNPPYIKTSDIFELQREVKEYEPHIALDGGEDGLIFYRSITEKASKLLKSGGLLAFEIGYNQRKEVLEIMSEKFNDIEIINDLSGNVRVAIGFMP